MPDKYPMTPRGLTVLKEELKRCKEVERPRIVRAIEEARAHGDLSENAEYSAAKEAQSHNEGRIGKLEEQVALAGSRDLAGVVAAKQPVAVARDQTVERLADSAGDGGQQPAQRARPAGQRAPEERCGVAA